MKNWTKIILISGIFLIITIIFSMIYLVSPKIIIELNGSKSITLPVGEKYVESGAKAYIKYFFAENKSLDVTISGEVKNDKLGNYDIVYKVDYKGKKFETTRKVKVVDNEKPLITLNGKVYACKSNNKIDFDIYAIDNYDGDISDNVTYKINNNKIYFSIEDSSKNKAEISKEIEYRDEEKPSISLKGSATITLYLGEEYIENGASAYDSCDGDLTKQIKISNNINAEKIGDYEVTYTVKDAYGNTTVKKRKVQVTNNPIKAHNYKIYFTFDDGPGQYTEQLLKILDNYNVKATFFVTNQFPKYQYLIKSEYDKGHTVGIHTYSHKWNIYSSVDSYLQDFNKIETIVYEQTGIHPTIFRFPGGSSNTVSKKYSKGIMTNLAGIMTQKGYIYFDWSFDSGDTSKTNNSKDSIIKNVESHLNTPNNYIILMHDIKKNTIEALPEIIEYAQKKGYSFSAIKNDTPVVHFKIAN